MELKGPDFSDLRRLRPTQCGAVDAPRGLVWKGAERNGCERNGKEGIGKDRSGQEQTGWE